MTMKEKIEKVAELIDSLEVSDDIEFLEELISAISLEIDLAKEAEEDALAPD